MKKRKEHQESKLAKKYLYKDVSTKKIKDNYVNCLKTTKFEKFAFSQKCDEPSLPKTYGGEPVTEYIQVFHSLSEAEDPLNISVYPLPENDPEIQNVLSECGKHKTIKDKFYCISKWVYENIDYDSNHSSLSVQAGKVLGRNKSKEKEHLEYPMHRYMTSKETFEAKKGICGENSQLIVALARRLGIPSSLYRPKMSHFNAIAEDPDKHEFYVYDGSFNSDCIIKGRFRRPKVVSKRFEPTSSYTLGVTTFKDFNDWTLDRRRKVGTAKLCQLLVGTHDEKTEIRKGYYTNKDGTINKKKLKELELKPDEANRIIELYNRCANYIDKIYETSEYYDISYDTENILQYPPSEDLINSINGKEIIDVEYAYECNVLPYKTTLGKVIEKALEDKCGKVKELKQFAYRTIPYYTGYGSNYWYNWAFEEANEDGFPELITSSASPYESCSFEYGDLTYEQEDELITDKIEREIFFDKEDYMTIDDFFYIKKQKENEMKKIFYNTTQNNVIQREIENFERWINKIENKKYYF